MEEMARLSRRSKPRRLGISSRKSVLAEAFNSSICDSARLSSLFSRRISALASPEAADLRVLDEARCRAGLPPTAPALRRFASLDAVVLVFFLIGLLDHDVIKWNRIMISSLCLSMIFSENGFPLFRIMLWGQIRRRIGVSGHPFA